MAKYDAEIERARKVGIVAGVLSLASAPLMFLTLFFLTGMTTGPFAGFASAMAWPIVFITILASPILLAVGFVQAMRVRNMRENNK